mgnify:CR=1 FL=1
MFSSNSFSLVPRPQKKLELRVANGQYKLMKKIGSGGFGQIFLGKDFEKNFEVAVKLEPKSISYS